VSGHPPDTPDSVRAWGRHTHGSPLYGRLTEVVASDPELMRVLNRIENLPRPNLLFAGVQYLLAKGASPALDAYYASRVTDAASPKEAGPIFTGFVLAHEDELAEIGRTRRTQTNECRRCSGLLPMIWHGAHDEFHLVDFGTSAGLNLALDRYSYRWDGVTWGSGRVRIEAESRGRPPVPRDIRVMSRIGLDLNPIDPASEDERDWLVALIWPEQHERRERLTAALDEMGRVDYQLVPGDAIQTLEATLERMPAGDPVVVMNSFVFIQLTPEQREAVDEVVGAARERRPVLRASMEIVIKEDVGARLVVDDGSGPEEIGRAHTHGEWIDLL